MSILINEKERIFHLQNQNISYIMKVLRNGQLGQIYFGRRLHDCTEYDHLVELGHRDMAPCVFDGETTFSMEHLKQEYPGFGTGDMRYPAVEIRCADGSRVTEFLYDHVEVQQGKPKLAGLPAVYVEEDQEAETLKVVLKDTVKGLKLVLSYTIFRDFPVIARNAWIQNEGEQSVNLEKAMSVSVDFPDCDYEMFYLTGASLRERHPQIQPLHQGIQDIHSLRGHSSHQFNPFLALKRPDAGEKKGEVYGFSLVYSGNFLGQTEVDTMGTTRVMMGIHPTGFSWPLAPGEGFQTPEAVLVWSDQGLNGMSQTYHTLYRKRLARGYWRDRERPILINNWEATYMDFDEEKILFIAEKARELGIELFVLDDGWFGKRNDDTSSLGDWDVNPDKLPSGIAGLAQKIQDMGMLFGLWFEPEMASRDSDLFREHPDWILGSPDRHICSGRHQYVLDFSKEDVVDYIGDKMEAILSSGPISYVKWDMNRSISDLYSRGTDPRQQGTIYHRQILGIYRLYERLIQKFPQVLFESCASGGGRFDPGMLYYAPQAWASDDTDASQRVLIQYGSSYVYPLSSIGSHVSACPNHQTFRSLPLKMRGDVAYFGTFGYELDLNTLNSEEQNEVKEQIRFMKKYRRLIHNGTFYRLKSPFRKNADQVQDAAWMVVSQDKKQALLAYYRLHQPVNVGYQRIKLEGLSEDMQYHISDRPYSAYGDELMQIGLDVSDWACGVRWSEQPQGEGVSRIILLEA